MKLHYYLAFLLPVGSIAQSTDYKFTRHAIHPGSLTYMSSASAESRLETKRHFYLPQAGFTIHQQQDTHQKPNETKPINALSTGEVQPNENLSNAKTFQVMGTSFLVLAVGSATYSLLLKEPTEPISYVNVDDYLNYKEEQDDYRLKKNVANGLALTSAALSVASILLANHYLLKVAESKQTAFKLAPNGFSVSYNLK